MKFLVLPLLVWFYLKTVASLDCYWNSECKYKYFSSKTPYENVRGDIRDSIVKQNGCEPISVWGIIRHGQRNPGLKFLKDIEIILNFKDDIISSYDNGNSSLCAQDVDNLRHWKIDRSFFEEPNRIPHERYQELLGIGSRLREALPELLNEIQKEDYLFCPTFGPRTLSSAEAFIEGCEAIGIWAMIRHGKRQPSIKYSQDLKDFLQYKDNIISSYETGNSSLCAQDIENIRNWEIKGMFDGPKEIANEGYQELLGMGSRLKEAFPKLLNDLQEEDHLFLPAFGQRMEKSATAFAEGLNHKKLVIVKANDDYSIMAPFSTCGKFQVEVLRNPDVYYEEAEYKETADYLDMKERVERRLGLNFTFTNNEITAMYDLCRYSWEGITNTPSPWCALFSVEDLKVLEYIGDLRHYHRNGYGVQDYSKVLGQIPLADLLTKFEQTKNGKGKKIVSYFTHATMMDMILVVLNLYKDTNPLTGALRDINRKWRTTFLSTFASNMIAVMNRCSKPDDVTYDYKIAFYWNEKPLLQMCKEGVCSWQEFQDKFKPFLNATTDVCEFKWTLLD